MLHVFILCLGWRLDKAHWVIRY